MMCVSPASRAGALRCRARNERQEKVRAHGAETRGARRVKASGRQKAALRALCYPNLYLKTVSLRHPRHRPSPLRIRHLCAARQETVLFR